MLSEIYWIPVTSTGRLAIMARPRAGEWLEDEIANWRIAGLSKLVSALEPQEVSELGLEHEPALCERSGISFQYFPIKDRGVPDSVTQTARLCRELAQTIEEGGGVAIHCRAGIGRSSLIAACVMARLGYDIERIFPILSAARKVETPDTEEQVRWFRSYVAEKMT